jgi:hypothetical protein
MVARRPLARVQRADHLDGGHVVEPLGDSHVVAGILRESAQLSGANCNGRHEAWGLRIHYLCFNWAPTNQEVGGSTPSACATKAMD